MLKKLGIEVVTMPLPFRLNHVNCFLAENETGYTIIDSGLTNEETIKKWEEQLANKDVTQMIITHSHIDHVGYAGELQKITNADVFMTEVDYNSLDHIIDNTMAPYLRRDYRLANVPDHITEDIINLSDEYNKLMVSKPHNVTIINEGDKFIIGGREYEVMFTPGHADGLIVLYNKTDNVLLSTDHILPHITPNISYWFFSDPNPLATYEKSLKKVRKLNAEFVIPSHGTPFYDANKRIDEIWEHHIDRLSIAMQQLERGINDVFDICNALFPQQLSSYEYQFAIGETIAHLEYLRGIGECVREEQNGKWVYFLPR